MLQWPSTIDLLAQGLEASALRHAVIADNIANVNTPGFKRAVVSFEAELAQALGASPGRLKGQTTHQLHIPIGSGRPPEGVRPQVAVEADRTGRNDGNNVDIEVEQANSAINQLWYGALSRQISDQFARYRLVIEGRR